MMKAVISLLGTWRNFLLKWRTIMVQAFASGLIILALLVLLSAAWRTWGNNPPITLINIGPSNLGMICPGQELPLTTRVIITSSIIVIYYINVNNMDGSTVLGTQRAFTDNLYPDEVDFVLALPWTVPDLPEGEYIRVLAARNVAGHQNTVWSKVRFRVGKDCRQ